MILTASCSRPGPPATPCLTCSGSTKQVGKKVAVVAHVGAGEVSTGKLEARVPIRWWLELLAIPITTAELIVGRSLFQVAQYRVSLVDFLHAQLGIRFLAHIRMIFTCQLAVGLLDFILAGALVQAENLVVILEFQWVALPCWLMA